MVNTYKRYVRYLTEVFVVLMSISCREGVACGQYLITIQCSTEVFVLISISCQECDL